LPAPLAGDDGAANKLIDAAHSTTRDRIVVEPGTLPVLFPWRRAEQGKTGSIAVNAVRGGELGDGLLTVGMVGRPRQDSNLRTRLRRPMLYPLSYEGRTSKRSAASGRGRTR
jgi:hypothetical protein